MNNNLNEQEFVERLNNITDMAQSQGNVISSDELSEALDDLSLNDEQMSLVYEYLKSKKIGVDEPVDYNDFMTGEDKRYIDIYLEELKDLPVVNESEEEAYLIQAISGDMTSKNKLIECFLPTVVDIAKLYTGQGVSIEDLIGEGNVALTILMDMLGSQDNPSDAKDMIVQMLMRTMEDYINEDYEEHQGFSMWADKANLVLEKAKELYTDLMRKITIDELANETGLTQDFILDVIKVTGNGIEYIEVK